jgi:hypothetical protein
MIYILYGKKEKKMNISWAILAEHLSSNCQTGTSNMILTRYKMIRSVALLHSDLWK